jgi:hypothetical protein
MPGLSVGDIRTSCSAAGTTDNGAANATDGATNDRPTSATDGRAS